MIHVYHHTFLDGDKLALTVDTSTTPFTFKSSNPHMPEHHRDEFDQWVDQVVIPDIMGMADKAQVRALAKVGLQALRGER